MFYNTKIVFFVELIIQQKKHQVSLIFYVSKSSFVIFYKFNKIK